MKNKLIVVAPDGKNEMVEGKELLQKDPMQTSEEAEGQNANQVAVADRTLMEQAIDKKKKKVKKSSIELRWEELRKELDNQISIMSIKDAMADDEQPQEQEQPQQDDQDDTTGLDGLDDEHHEAIQDIISQHEQEHHGDDQEQPQEDNQEASQQEEQPSTDDLANMMQEMGYSDEEIAFIIHNHVASDDPEDIKNKQKQMHEAEKLDHAKKMNEIERNKATTEASVVDPVIDKDHKKQMLELEREFYRREREIELEFKEREMELKLKAKKQAMEDRAKEVKQEKDKETK